MTSYSTKSAPAFAPRDMLSRVFSMTWERRWGEGGEETGGKKLPAPVLTLVLAPVVELDAVDKGLLPEG